MDAVEERRERVVGDDFKEMAKSRLGQALEM